jgi:hypothetical protein
MELIKETKLSSRTVNKHLEQLIHAQLIEKRSDIQNGKYAVLFRVKPELMHYVKNGILRRRIADDMENLLSETKGDPLPILELIHENNQLYFLDLLERIQRNKNMPDEQIQYFTDIFLLAPYRQWTTKLIEASLKTIDKIDINQAVLEHLKRQTRVSLKTLEKLGYITTTKSLMQSLSPTRDTNARNV